MPPSSSDTSSSRAPRGASSPSLAAPITNPQPCDQNNTKKFAWGNTTTASSSNGEMEVGPVMGAADSWPALGESSAIKTVPKSSSPTFDSTKISSKSSSGSNNGGAVSSPMPSVSGETILPEKKESLASPRNNNSNWDHGSSSRGGSSNGFSPQSHSGPDHHHRPFNRRGISNGGYRGNGWHNNPHPRHVAPQPPRSFFGLQPPAPPVGPVSFVGIRSFMGPPMGFPAEIPSHVYYLPPAAFVAPYVAVHPMAHALPPSMVDNAAELRAAVSKQIEYYFSNDNLVKDTYLRKQMDDQGWVPVSLIAGFRQVKNITINIQNNINFILDSIRNLELVEVQGEKIRRRGDWMKWLMNTQPSQNGGPLGPHSQSVPNTDNIVDGIQGVVLEEGTSDRSASVNLINQSQFGDE